LRLDLVATLLARTNTLSPGLEQSDVVQEEILYPPDDPENRIRYHGDVCNGLPWGNGSMIWSYGATYTGSWVHGKRQGRGTFTYTPDPSEFDAILDQVGAAWTADHGNERGKSAGSADELVSISQIF
jgi:hypothetical protein